MSPQCAELFEFVRRAPIGLVVFLEDGTVGAASVSARALLGLAEGTATSATASRIFAAARAASAQPAAATSRVQGDVVELPAPTFKRLRVRLTGGWCPHPHPELTPVLIDEVLADAGVLDDLWEYHRFFNASSTVQCVVDEKGRVVHCNPALGHLLGVDPAQALAEERVHPDDAALTAEAFAGRGPVEHLVNRWRHADGTWRTFSWTATRDVSPRWGPCWYAHGVDVTDRIAHTEALHRSRAELAEAHRIARLGRLEIESDSRMVTYSAELAEMLQLGHRRLSTMESLLSLVSPDEQPRLRNALVHAQRGDESIIQLTLTRGDGSKVDAKLWLRPRRADGGQVSSVVAVLQDVSEHAHLSAKLQLAERLASMGTMAAGIAHEINNPLAFVIANLNSVKHDLAKVPLIEGVDLVDVREALEEAAEGAERVRQIVSDLKTFTRTDEKHVGPVDVRRVVQAALNMARNETKHRAQVVTQLSAVEPVHGNEARLGQVFLNLVVNAAQAIPDGHATEHRITVSTRMEGESVVVAVEDTGKGIPPEVLPRIFDPFFTTKKIGEGTGLGLFISQGIVQELGGDIRVRSAVGAGTTFEVRLPAAEPEEYQSHPSPVPTVARARVLVVDDEPAILKAMQRILGRRHEVVTVESGREALALLEKGERFDVIFCDVMMPDLTGIDVWQQLRPQQRESLVFMSGGTFTDRAREFLEVEKPPLLDKPMDLTVLEKIVARRVLGLPIGK